MTIRWGASIALVLLLPLLAGVWLLERFDRNLHLEAIRQQQETVNRLVAGFSRRAERTGFFQEAVDRVRRALVWNQDPAAFIAALPAGSSRIFLFGPEGKRMQRAGFSPELVAASERVHRLLAGSETSDGKIANPRDRKLTEAFLGTSGAIALMRENRGRLVNLEPVGVARSAAFVPFRPRRGERGSFVFLVDHERVAPVELMRTAERRMKRLSGGAFDFGTADLQVASGPWGRLADESLPTSTFEGAGRLWSTILLDARYLLWCSAEVSPPLPPFVSRHRPLTVVLTLAFLAGFGGILILSKRGVPLRLLTGILFSLAGLACILVMLGFGALSLASRRVVLERQRIDTSFETLQRLDEGFSPFCRVLERRYRQELDRLTALPRTVDWPPREAFRALPGSGRDFSVILFDASGAVRLHQPSPADSLLRGIWGESPLEQMGRIVEAAVRVFNSTLTLGDREQSLTSTSITPILRRGALEMNRNPGMITTLRFGSKELISYFEFIQGEGGAGKSGLASGSVWIIQRPRLLENAYMRQACASVRGGQASARITFRVMSISSGGTVGAGRAFRPFRAEISAMRDEIAQTRGPVSRFVRWRSRPYLLSGYPGRQLGGIDLFCLMPLSDIERESGRLSRLFAGLGLLMLVFAIALSSVFSRLLLQPMREMGEGLQRLSESDFRRALGLPTGDEFEAIGNGINAIAEEMKELSFARGIREQLIPQKPLLMPHAAVFGWTSSRSEIGGEIFDFQALPDKTTLLWMAGRPGHSIGSALLLAMTKMAVRLVSDLGTTSPSVLIQELARQFPDPETGFVNGELCCALLDPTARRLLIACRGLFAPLVARNGSGEATVAHSRREDGIREWDLALVPGERVYLLSPGLMREASVLQRAVAGEALTAEAAGPKLMSALWDGSQETGGRATATLLLCEVRAE